MKHFCADIDATKTAHLLEFNRKTVNRYFGIFRDVIVTKQFTDMKQLFGTVEVDESYFGANRKKGKAKKKRGRGTTKQPVFGILERNGRVYTEIIPNCSKKTLQGIIKGKVDPTTIINSDSWSGYSGLVNEGFKKHFKVNHSKDEFSKGNGVHINGIESFWSFSKRRLSKFNGVKVNFGRHLKECEWRWKKSVSELENDLTGLLKKILL